MTRPGSLTAMLAADMAAKPDLHWASGPIASATIDAWVARGRRPIAAGLVELWSVFGGGEMFESEDIYAPGVVLENGVSFDIDPLNAGYYEEGLAPELLMFHTGVTLSAIDVHGAVVEVDKTTLAPMDEFGPVAAWYESLRAAHGLGA